MALARATESLVVIHHVLAGLILVGFVAVVCALRLVEPCLIAKTCLSFADATLPVFRVNCMHHGAAMAELHHHHASHDMAI